MKIAFYLLFFYATLFADDTNRNTTYLSVSTNNLVARVGPWQNNRSFALAAPMYLGLSSLTDGFTHVYFPSEGHFVHALLIATDGRRISLSTRGQKLTSKFMQVSNYHEKFLAKTGNLRRPFEQTIVGSNGLSTRALPSVHELFSVRGSGPFTLELQFQIFAHKVGDTNEPKLVRFPPFRIPLEKEE